MSHFSESPQESLREEHELQQYIDAEEQMQEDRAAQYKESLEECLLDAGATIEGLKTDLSLEQQRVRDRAAAEQRLLDSLGGAHDEIRRLELDLHLEQQRAIELESVVARTSARAAVWEEAVVTMELWLRRGTPSSAQMFAETTLRRMQVPPSVVAPEEDVDNEMNMN
jgi:hypothetical protein